MCLWEKSLVGQFVDAKLRKPSHRIRCWRMVRGTWVANPSYYNRGLQRVPLELWTDRGLAVLASAVDKPISFEVATREQRWLSYVRICVQVDDDLLFPSTVTVRMQGQEFIIPVVYEWKPRRCTFCGSFGHPGAVCEKQGVAKS
ncbi:uncharacterized protein LOC120068928 [Benincasa hispida]|uniref:uncharacterized protein LOC120068928 n=1 Tax=Benincasa hispida TaxID=102211 RepID=UPI001900D8DE|nr:uncharacterized protein LOC120068928 [Benincasa hispida]